MKRDESQRGFTLPLVFVFSVAVFGAALFLLARTTQEMDFSTKHRRLKSATALANNTVTDLMRQFSQNSQENHYSSANLNRDPALFGKGYQSISITPNENQHFLSFDASGSYGDDPNDPLQRKTVQGVIKFISNMTTFGTMSNGSFTTSASNVTYTGKVWINGNWSVTGSNIVVQGGPVFLNGNLSASGAGSLTVNGNLYRTGTRSGPITVNGSDYNFVPQMTWPTIDRTYYDAISNVRITANANVRFSWDGVSPTGNVRVGTTTYPIPSTGFIIYGQNCTLTSSGTVRGKVTMVSARTGGAVGGNIVIDDTLKYATPGSTSNASVNDSFGAIATNSIAWNKTGNADLYVSGTYFVDSPGTSGMSTACSACVSRTFRFFGTRNKQITTSGWSSSQISFDTNLDTYPPPGLPEHPYLVSWEIR